MKRQVILLVFLSATAMLLGQNYGQTSFVLDEVIPNNNDVVYEATTSIKLVDGFCCKPDTNKSVMLKINRFGVFPPEDGMLGGPWTSDKDGVVGALPGELNVSEFGSAVYSIPILLPSGIGNMTPNTHWFITESVCSVLPIRYNKPVLSSL